jgi:hypothetical protein
VTTACLEFLQSENLKLQAQLLASQEKVYALQAILFADGLVQRRCFGIRSGAVFQHGILRPQNSERMFDVDRFADRAGVGLGSKQAVYFDEIRLCVISSASLRR